jgi:RNA polymerase sigma-70 factor (ECF subfamily)
VSSRERQQVEAILRGDKTVCHAVISEFLPSLVAFFRGMGMASSVAEDLAQETFLEFWRSLSSFRGESSLKTWLFVIGRRVAWRHIRKKRLPVAKEDEQIWDELDDGGHKQDELLWKREQKEQLAACVASLPASHKEVLLLHYMEELSIREVATVLSIAEGTVKSRLNRALGQLRTSFPTPLQ